MRPLVAKQRLVTREVCCFVNNLGAYPPIADVLFSDCQARIYLYNLHYLNLSRIIHKLYRAMTFLFFVNNAGYLLFASGFFL